MIINQVKEQLMQLASLLNAMNDESYTASSRMLNKATVGQHVRRIIELMQVLVAAYDKGCINYDERKRDQRIETDLIFASEQIELLSDSLSREDKMLRLVVPGTAHARLTYVNTSYYRELAYNTEHAIHHMALIRVALREFELDLVTENFGVAYATIQYRKEQCAQ